MVIYAWLFKHVLTYVTMSFLNYLIKIWNRLNQYLAINLISDIINKHCIFLTIYVLWMITIIFLILIIWFKNIIVVTLWYIII